MAIKYFFDTYAFYEFIDGNNGYKTYFEKFEIVTTRLNLVELLYSLIKDFGFEFAKKCYYAFLPYVIEFSDETVEKAMLFRFLNRKKNLSYVDCIGYTCALENGLKFLTGDNEFKEMKGVEFVR